MHPGCCIDGTEILLVPAHNESENKTGSLYAGYTFADDRLHLCLHCLKIPQLTVLIYDLTVQQEVSCNAISTAPKTILFTGNEWQLFDAGALPAKRFAAGKHRVIVFELSAQCIRRLSYDQLPETGSLNAKQTATFSFLRSFDPVVHSALLCVIKAADLTVELLSAPLSSKENVSGSEKKKLEVVKNILREKYNEEHSLRSLAKSSGLNEYKLKKMFKQHYGLTVFGYLFELRMQKAAELLQKQNASVSHIAYAVGYANTGAFSSAFKRYFGYSPKHHR